MEGRPLKATRAAARSTGLAPPEEASFRGDRWSAGSFYGYFPDRFHRISWQHLAAGLSPGMRSLIYWFGGENRKERAKSVAIAGSCILFSRIMETLNSRVRIFRGDLTGERFGLSDDEYHRDSRSTECDPSTALRDSIANRKAVQERESSRLARK